MGAGTGNGSDGLKSASGDRTARVPVRVTAPEGWVPAFEGQRPPFTEGNTLAVKHGAKSPRQVEPIAQGIVAELLAGEVTAYLREPRYQAAVLAWARAEARVSLVADYVDSMPIEMAMNSKAGSTSPLEQLRRLEATALTHRSRLGLDPMSAAKLSKDVAQTKQADMATEMTKLREQHERATHGPIDGQVADRDDDNE